MQESEAHSAAVTSAPTQIALALDGHDGSGKTTLARRLAEALGGRYVRPYGPPHGERMLAAALAGASVEALEHARAAMRAALRDCADAHVVVLDRAWLTVLTLIPAELHAAWQPRIPSMLCWADLDTTVQRLRDRGELAASGPIPPADLAQHRHYLDAYQQLAQQHACPVLRTDQQTEAQSLHALIVWAECNSHVTRDT